MVDTLFRDVRYVVASIGLALMLTLPLVTAVQRVEQVLQSGDPGTNVARVSGAARVPFEPSAGRTPIAAAAIDSRVVRDGAAHASDVWIAPLRGDAIPLLFAVWLAGVILLSLRPF